LEIVRIDKAATANARSDAGNNQAAQRLLQSESPAVESMFSSIKLLRAFIRARRTENRTA
jgi:hypothetical protein